MIPSSDCLQWSSDQPGPARKPRAQAPATPVGGTRSKRVDYPELKAAVQNQAARSRAQRVLVEDAGAGTSLVQELRTKVSGIIAVRPDGDKVSRMAVVSAKFEAGQVFLPERASWLADFKAELFAFPGSRNDDQCDSVSQALSEQNVRFPLIFSPETIASLAQLGSKNRLIYGDSGHGYSWCGLR